MVAGPLKHTSAPTVVALSPDGKTALIGCWGKSAAVWDVTGEKPLASPLLHGGTLTHVAFSPDGKFMISASIDDKVRLWEIAQDPPAHLCLEHESEIVSAVFAPDGGKVLTYARQSAQVWDVTSGKLLGKLLVPETPNYNRVAVFTRDGRALVARVLSKGREVAIWDIATGQALGPMLQHEAPVTSLAISADGKFVLTACAKTSAQFWEVAGARPIGGPLRPPSRRQDFRIKTVSISPDCKTLLTEYGGAIWLWEADTGKELGPQLQTGSVFEVGFSPDGKLLFTVGVDRVELWDVATRRRFGSPFEAKLVTKAAFGVDGSTVLTAGFWAPVQLWNVPTGKPLRALHHPGQMISAVALGPDSRTFLTAIGKKAFLWRVRRPLEWSAAQVRLWTSALTGTELDENGSVNLLDTQEWRERVNRFAHENKLRDD
jgi:WD40 repeat protein